MTLNTAIDPASLVAALADAAAPLLSTVPGLSEIGAPRVVTSPGEAVDLGQGSQAIVTRLGANFTGSLTFAIAESVAAVLCDGPLGTQGILAALDQSITDLVANLGDHLGLALSVESPGTLDGQLAINEAMTVRAGQTVVVIDLRGQDGLVGAIAIVSGGENAQDFEFQSIVGDQQSTGRQAANGVPVASMEMLADVEMAVTAELGRSRMTVRSLLGLTVGSVVELDRSADSAVDLFVNGTLIARGEVVIINEEFGVRVTEIVTRSLKR